MSDKIKIYLFADETNIYVESDTICELVQIVKKELKLFNKWIDENLLSLDISKTNYIFFISLSCPFHLISLLKSAEHINGSN